MRTKSSLTREEERIKILKSVKVPNFSGLINIIEIYKLRCMLRIKLAKWWRNFQKVKIIFSMIPFSDWNAYKTDWVTFGSISRFKTNLQKLVKVFFLRRNHLMITIIVPSIKERKPFPTNSMRIGVGENRKTWSLKNYSLRGLLQIFSQIQAIRTLNFWEKRYYFLKSKYKIWNVKIKCFVMSVYGLTQYWGIITASK